MEKAKQIKRVCITGGLGFIGSNFIHYLFDKYPRCEVVNLDLLTYAGNLENLKEIDSLSNYKFVKGDICDVKLVDSLVKECDAVVHFAAESHVDRSITDPTAFVRTNVMGTQVLLDACVKYAKRFHHISTDEIFGSLALDDKKSLQKTQIMTRQVLIRLLKRVLTIW